MSDEHTTRSISRAPDELWTAHVKAAARGDILRLPTDEPVVGPWCIRCGIHKPNSYNWVGFIEATDGDPARLFDESERSRREVLLCSSCTRHSRELEDTLIACLEGGLRDASWKSVSDEIVLFEYQCETGSRQLQLEMRAHQQWKQTQPPMPEYYPTARAWWEAVFDWDERYGRQAGVTTDRELAMTFGSTHGYVRKQRRELGRPRRTLARAR